MNRQTALLVAKGYRHGARYCLRIIRECRRLNLAISLGFALVEQESGFRNIFGHDPTIYAGAGRVTKRKYLAYRKQRGPTGGGGMQGVGPTQLTYYSYQDKADGLGGCWKPGVNIHVGLEIIAGHVKADGVRKGLAVYNGGDAHPNYKYADEVLALKASWHERLS